MNFNIVERALHHPCANTRFYILIRFCQEHNLSQKWFWWWVVTGHRGYIRLYFLFEMKNYPFCLLWSRQTHVARRLWWRALCQPQSCNYSSRRNSSSLTVPQFYLTSGDPERHRQDVSGTWVLQEEGRCGAGIFVQCYEGLQRPWQEMV